MSSREGRGPRRQRRLPFSPSPLPRPPPPCGLIWFVPARYLRRGRWRACILSATAVARRGLTLRGAVVVARRMNAVRLAVHRLQFA